MSRTSTGKTDHGPLRQLKAGVGNTDRVEAYPDVTPVEAYLILLGIHLKMGIKFKNIRFIANLTTKHLKINEAVRNVIYHGA